MIGLALPLRLRPKRFLFLLSFLFAPCNAFAGVEILDLGLDGYPSSTVTRIAIRVDNLSAEEQKFELRLKLNPRQRNRWQRPATEVVQSLTLRGRENRIIEVPYLFPSYGVSDADLDAEIRDATGVISRDRRFINGFVSWGIAMLCEDSAVCQKIEEGVKLDRSIDDVRLGVQQPRVSKLSQPRNVWWGYLPAKIVIVAIPLKQWTDEQLRALTEYLRLGGHVVLIEHLLGTTSNFLSEYRQSSDLPNEQIVGMGRLHRLRDARDVAALFKSRPAGRWIGYTGVDLRRSVNDELSWIRKRLGAHLQFPSIYWVIAWMAIYILVVGILNFGILWFFGKLEWGWLTVPIIASLFALSFYFAAKADKPKNFALESVAVSWLDDRTTEVAEEINVRVISPERKAVSVSVASEILFVGQPAAIFGNPDSGFGSLTDAGLNIFFDANQRIEYRALPWSFDDFVFQRVRRLSGRVWFSAPSRLKNESGINFTEGLFVDKDNVFFIGSFATGAEVDLSSAKREPLLHQIGRAQPYPKRFALADTGTVSQQVRSAADQAEWEQLSDQPFSLVELIRGWPLETEALFKNRSGVFFGLSEAPALETKFSLPATSKRHQVIVVSFH